MVHRSVHIGMLLFTGVIGSIGVVGANGQAVPDTLDWHRYYPLAVGYVWEYQVSEGEPLLIHQIVGDSVTAEHHYFLMEVTSWDYDYIGGGTELEIWSRDTLFVRYADVGGIFKLGNLEADTLDTPRETRFLDGSFGFYNLQTAFGDSVQYASNPDYFYRTSGDYGQSVFISGQEYVTIAVKSFSGGWMSDAYAADIGLLSSMNLWGPRITYAEIGDTEYGFSRAVATEAVRDLPQDFAIESIYPNPVRREFSVKYRMAIPGSITVEAYDTLGRRVYSEVLPAQPIGEHSLRFDGSGWAPGVYLVRLRLFSGRSSVRSLVKTR